MNSPEKNRLNLWISENEVNEIIIQKTIRGMLNREKFMEILCKAEVG